MLDPAGSARCLASSATRTVPTLLHQQVLFDLIFACSQVPLLRAVCLLCVAVSLHATTDEVRSWIVPTNRKYPLGELIGALRELYPLPAGAKRSSSSSSSDDGEADSSSSDVAAQRQQPPPKSDDFVVIEYVLLKDVNDTGEPPALCFGPHCHVCAVGRVQLPYSTTWYIDEPTVDVVQSRG